MKKSNEKPVKEKPVVDWLQAKLTTKDGLALVHFLINEKVICEKANINNTESGFVADREGLGELTDAYKQFFVTKGARLVKFLNPVMDDDFDALWQAACPDEDEEFICKPILVAGDCVFIGFNEKLSNELMKVLETRSETASFTETVLWVPLYYNCSSETFVETVNKLSA